jgi:ABC-type transport system substrate-binding protein
VFEKTDISALTLAGYEFIPVEYKNTSKTRRTDMAAPQTKKMEKRNDEEYQIRCNQVNLQHSKAGTGNLMQVITTEKIGIALIQKPYFFQGRPLGITNIYRTFTAGEGNCRAAIVVPDTKIDGLLITQLSDNNAILLEIDSGQIRFYAASIYTGYESIENNKNNSKNCKVYQRSKFRYGN